MRVEALEGGQQGRVDVDHAGPASAATNQGVNSRMKPARQTRSIRCVEQLLHRAPARTPRGPCRTPCGRRPRSRCRSVRARASPARVRAVGDDERDLGGIVGAFAASISAAMFEPRPEIRMATRLRCMVLAQRQSRGRAARIGDAIAAPRARRHLAERHDAVAGLRERRFDCAGAVGRSTIATMPMPQLNVRSISASAMPPVAASHWNTGRTGTRARSMPTRRVLAAARAECCR